MGSIAEVDGDVSVGNETEDSAILCSLRASAEAKDLYKGIQIHADILKKGMREKSFYVADALVRMYTKCCALERAKNLLYGLPFRDVFSWTALIAGYIHQGKIQHALNCYHRMRGQDVSPNVVTYVCILKACGSIGEVEMGKQVHDEIVDRAFLGNDLIVGTALVDMYSKCGQLAKAKDVLKGLPVRDVLAWTALMTGYAQRGHGEEVLQCFEEMHEEDISPDAWTFACVLKACGSLGATAKGEQIHHEISNQGLLAKEIGLGNALVDMYVKCGVLTKAQQVLEELSDRNVISWNTIIVGYVQHGQGQDALDCFEQMRRHGLSPDEVTYTGILKACGIVGATEKGERIHDEILRHGLLGDNVALGNALVDMYIKCTALSKARQVLEELHVRDVFSWTTVISGYTQQGQGEQALNCFRLMLHDGISPNAVTFSCVLKACGSTGAVNVGKEIHNEIVQQGLLENNSVLGNALVDMYAKCGALGRGQQVLEELPTQTVVAWTAQITGYAQRGQSQGALNCFKQMLCRGISPDSATFSCVLNACSHAGLVDEGHVYFVDMSSKFGIEPNLEHYTCMVDLYGRAGHLDKAVAVIKKMPSSDHMVIWCTLLGSCLKWKDVIVGRWAFAHALQVDEHDVSVYILMANIYTAAGMPEDAQLIEAMVGNKEAGHSV